MLLEISGGPLYPPGFVGSPSTSATWVVELRKKHVNVSLFTDWPLTTLVASLPPVPHLVELRGLRRYWLSLTPDDPKPRRPSVATFADMPVSVSTQLVPSVGHNTVVVWAEEQVPSAGPPVG